MSGARNLKVLFLYDYCDVELSSQNLSVRSKVLGPTIAIAFQRENFQRVMT